MEFETKVDIDVYGTGKDDISTSDARLIWDLDLEMRNEGVKAIYITPKFLLFSMEWIENTHHDLEKDIWEEEEKYEDFEIDLTKGDWTVKEEIEIDRSIYPQSVNIDFDTKEIIVS